MRTVLAAFLVFFTLSFEPAIAEVPDNYQSLTAVEKQQILWANIEAEPYTLFPALNGESGPSLRQLFFSGIKHAFTSPTDEIQPKRTKIIHKWGSAVKIAFEADSSSPYTGLFETGAVGVARLSLALPYEPSDDFVPGLAVKLMVDGQPSQNLTVMEKLEGQGTDTNYFKATFTNVLPDPETTSTQFGTWAFERFVEDAIHLKVDHVASVAANGQLVQNPKAPFQLLFKPAAGLATDSNAADFRLELAKIPAGTVLYEVYGRETEAKNSPVVRLGRIVTQSEFIAGRYEDEKLYFQHAGTELKSGYISW